MVVVSFQRGLDAAGWKIAPMARYVMSDAIFRSISQSLTATSREKHGKEMVGEDGVRTWSMFNSYERRYGGQDLNGRRLAIYRENGFGDNLMVTGLTGYLKTTYPQSTIDVYSLPRVASAWMGNTDANFLDICPPFDALRNGYDYHVMLEGMIENNGEDDQGNAYDDLFTFCGIFPKSVPVQFKKPQIFWTPDDDKAEEQWSTVKPSAPYVVWHWNPSGRARQYPFDLSREAILLLAEKFNVVVIGDTEGGIEGPQMTNPNVHDFVNRTPNFRGLLPVLKNATAVVCPDSAIAHLATAFPHIPCIGLWGSFHHQDRVKYYPNHFPLEAYASCPSAPCRAQRSALPVERCSQAAKYEEGTPFCSALRAIEPERIFAEVMKRL